MSLELQRRRFGCQFAVLSLVFLKTVFNFHRLNTHGLVLLDTSTVNGELGKWNTDMQPSLRNLKCCMKVESKQSDNTSESRVSRSNGALPLSPCQVEIRPHETLIYFITLLLISHLLTLSHLTDKGKQWLAIWWRQESRFLYFLRDNDARK